MMKKSNIAFLLIGLFVLCGMYYTETVQTAPAVALTKPGIPSIGKNYTVQQLLSLINTANPNKTSNFIVAVTANGNVIGATGNITSMTGSKSVSMAGLDTIIQQNLNTSVKLAADPTLVALLVKNGSLDSSTQQKYSQILLYFTLNGYRFYLNDPNPGRIMRSAGVLRSPAQSIIDKWNFNKSF